MANTKDKTKIKIKALALAKEGCSDEVIATDIGIDRRTLHNWRTADLEFGKKYEEAKASARLNLTRKGMSVAIKNETAVQHLLTKWIEDVNRIQEEINALEVGDKKIKQLKNTQKETLALIDKLKIAEPKTTITQWRFTDPDAIDKRANLNTQVDIDKTTSKERSRQLFRGLKKKNETKDN